MRYFIIAPLIIAAATWLTLIGVVNSECCNTKATLNYQIINVGCGAVGGRQDNKSCTITICANGEVMMGSHCGNGTCNSDGCDCVDGCLRGRWAKDFLAKNNEYYISVRDTFWHYEPK
ncbi:protein Diedel-like [Drosophila serrata]|uniref:protein Diedel-like n=1 Tax=Drosophila serrata TaxID=7274 RepID=UPI000A1CF555|nr:protein Diedel-like [Drosophila serrata]KAH8356031.1 hypothetical protein KR200_008167 [Drosophila serrata]